MLKTRKWKFQNFWGPEWIRTGGPSDLENLLSKFKSQMLENGALWANFYKNGALHSRHLKPPLWHSVQQPH